MRILFIAALTLIFVAPAKASIADLLNAIQQVESSGRANVPDGDNGEAIGPFQIHYDYWCDSQVGGSYEDCHNLDYSKRVVIAYWKRYAKRALKNNDYEALSRIHNGGPGGVHVKATVAYWLKVKAKLGE